MEIEINIPPLDLYTEAMAIKARLRVRTIKATKGIEAVYKEKNKSLTQERGRKPAETVTLRREILQWARRTL